MTEGFVDSGGLRAWYRVVPGDPAQLPLVVCHGGPGLTHDYLLAVAGLARSGRPCIFYDQFGNGLSGHYRDAPAEFWTIGLFLRELSSLTEHLGISRGFHLLGHSWGGMLGLELAVRRPAGLRSLVVASAFASAQCYRKEVARLVAGLPPQERQAAAGADTGSGAYQEAVALFNSRHVCRVRPAPDEVKRTVAALNEDPTVYLAMAGPSEFSLTGTLRDWDIRDRLHLVEVPVLLTSGRHDEVTPGAVDELRRGLPRPDWVLFEDSSHMAHVEEEARYLGVVGQFLRRHDPSPGSAADAGQQDVSAASPPAVMLEK